MESESAMSIKEQIANKASEIDMIIEDFLPEEEGMERIIYKSMNYSVRGGGKRLRPMLIKEMYDMLSGTDTAVYAFMSAMEMIHTYSLIHDDLPAMDNDDLRRGRLTNHKVFGEDIAILAGDALLNYAFYITAQALENTDTEAMLRAVKAMKVLTEKPGVKGMLGGQVVDVLLTGKEIDEEHLRYIYENKTGALIEASLMIGAILAGADEEMVQMAKKIGYDIGMAFQIQDDILDIEGDEAVIGKPVGSDEKNDKYTYATIYGLQPARDKVKELSDRAVAELEEFSAIAKNKGFKLGEENKEFLKELVIYMIDRDK